MNIGIARPGNFNDKRFQPSMQTNTYNYDLLTREWEKMGHTTTTIGFTHSCGADRLHVIPDYAGIEYDPTFFRTKTQQLISDLTVELLEDRDDLFDGIDVLIMPFYTFRAERGHYYPFAYLCAKKNIPLVVWDTDANFVGQYGYGSLDAGIDDVVVKIFCDPTYLHPEEVDYDIIYPLNLTVLSAALETPSYANYFPFFPLFEKSYNYDPEDKIYDLVYAGSNYRREGTFKYYYDVDPKLYYTVALYGKWDEEKIYSSFDWPPFYGGHIPRMHVQDALVEGIACVQIARDSYNKIGHITPRVFEVVQSGAILLMDYLILHSEQVVGEKYVVKTPEDVAEFLDGSSEEQLAEYWQEQYEILIAHNPGPEGAAKRFFQILEERNIV